LFDTLAAGQRVTLTKAHELILNELSSFTQQNIEFLEAPVTEQKAGLVEAPIAEFEPSSNKVDVSDLAAQFALDKQSLQSSDSNRDFDPDLLDIFLEEADELLVGIDADLNTWTADQQNVGALKNLMRYLHTLKGGSNMIQAGHIGLIAHELETIYEKLINQQLQPNPQLIAIIRAVQDDIADRIQTIQFFNVINRNNH
jgi:chemosensory pili system protein ChpA (sensor histidine kinase/response regulator)